MNAIALRLLLISVAASIVVACSGREHVVGNFIWSIPPNSDFYIKWSSNRSFIVGDILVFKFDTGLSDVTQVNRREYESCTAENPFKRILIGPATIPLDGEGMHYYICSFGNYCNLGQKLAIPVQRSQA